MNDGRVDVPDEPLDRPQTPAEQRRLTALRSLLCELGTTVAAGRVLAPEQVERLNAVIGRAPVRSQLEVTADGRYLVDFSPVGGEWVDRVERDLAGAFTSILRRSQPSRLKLCEADGCGSFFYDDTRNGARRWCDSRTCGNRTRVRRYRARALS